MKNNLGVIIPKNLDECFDQMKLGSSNKDLCEFAAQKEDPVTASLHFTYGMAMRNNWGLWGKNKLTKYFNSIGIYHADDMSGILLTSFHRHLNNKDIKLDEQVKWYQDYWKSIGFKDGNPTNDSKSNYKEPKGIQNINLGKYNIQIEKFTIKD